MAAPNTITSNLINNITGSSPDGVSEENFGTVTVNGTAAITVADTGYTLGDIVQFGLLTAGGTVGNVPFVASGTNGTGFTVKATASDSSIYNWIRFTPKAAQTS